jgi:hypothetical protein
MLKIDGRLLGFRLPMQPGSQPPGRMSDLAEQLKATFEKKDQQHADAS